MKKLIKLTLVVALSLTSTSLFAQKLGRINKQELIAVMPETQEMQTKMQAYMNDLREQMEMQQVEFNNKYSELSKEYNTLSEGMRNVREQELQDLQNRIQQFSAWAENDSQKKYAEMLEPIIDKADEAIAKVAKAGGYVAVFDVSMPSLAYFDESSMADIQPQVRAELGIAADAKPAIPTE